MSFRGRLALFFLLIVVIPIAAIALLVVNVTRDSTSGKADASLSTGLSTALTVYEREVEAAGDAVSELLSDRDIVAALQSGNPAEIESAARAAGSEAGLERLAVEPPNGPVIDAIGGDLFYTRLTVAVMAGIALLQTLLHLVSVLASSRLK